jgi:hypothetical protein
MVYYSLIINLVSAFPHLHQVDGGSISTKYVVEVFPNTRYVVRLKVTNI